MINANAVLQQCKDTAKRLYPDDERGYHACLVELLASKIREITLGYNQTL